MKTPRVAVLFLVFNRPETCAKVFDAIRQAKPPRLYVASDGPREGHYGEAERVERVREIASAVDWKCDLKTLFREKNLGCKHAVGSAITWFFEQEERGIVLEDDCLPHLDFFPYCESLLDRYANDERVSVITGNNFQDERLRGDASYYFSRYNHVWGWASWRRAWVHYEGDLAFWPEWKLSQHWKSMFSERIEKRFWERIFDRVYADEIDTWDYQWTASIWCRGGLTATPNVNLVSNIGFGSESTHTSTADHPHAKMKTGSLGYLCHPSEVVRDRRADSYTFEHAFNGKSYRFPWSWILLPRRALSFFYRRARRILFRMQ